MYCVLFIWGCWDTYIIANKTVFIHTQTTEFKHTDRTIFET